MKLFFSQNSPYARIARIAVRESGLTDFVAELPAANRQPDNPVLKHSPVGRVPTLIDGKFVVTEAKYVFQYIVAKSGASAEITPAAPEWHQIAQEGQVVGFVDGIANWIREIRREREHRSAFLINVEHDRAARCLAHLEQEGASGRLGDFPGFQWVALAVGLDLMDLHQLHPNWRTDCPVLSSWFDVQRLRSSMRETAPVR